MATALITGPTAGIGRAYAEALAERGYDLIAVARDAERLSALADDLAERRGVRTEVLPADLADLTATERVEDRLADPERPVDLLVNNAGFGLGQGFLGSSVDDEQRMLDVMVRAVLRLTKAAVPSMVKRGSGAIVNVSSMAGFVPYGTYGAAKAWVTSFTEAVAVELAGTGVRAVAVCPGFVRTEFHDRAAVDIAAPGLAWLSTDQVVDATMRHLDAGRRSPVLVPTARYRAAAGLARHSPRRLVSALMARSQMRSKG